METIRHGPPLPHLRVLAHALHIAGVVVADVLEGGEEDARVFVVEDAVCRCMLVTYSSPPLPPPPPGTTFCIAPHNNHPMRGECAALLTILDIADLDLLKDLGPDGGVDLLVAVDELGLEADDLGDAAARVALPRRVLLREADGLAPRRTAGAGAGAAR